MLTNSLKLLRKSIFEFMLAFIRNFDYKLLGFFVIYGTSFQIFNFLLNELSKETKQYRNSILAGFLAGAAFYLSPRYFLFTYASTTLIEVQLTQNHLYVQSFKQKSISQLLMQWILNKLNQSWKVTKFLKKVPWLKVFICITIPTFTHWQIVYPWLVPKFMDELMNSFTNDRYSKSCFFYSAAATIKILTI